MSTNSLLWQVRNDLGLSRDEVEAMSHGKIPKASLKRWEGGTIPREDGRRACCEFYKKDAKALGIVPKTRAIIGAEDQNQIIISAPQEGPLMSDLTRRAIFSSLGSRLSNIVNSWPRRDHHYEELQGEISRAIVEYNAVVSQTPAYELTRRQALRDMASIPIWLVGGPALIEAGKIEKTDPDLLLKDCAAGIAALWYLRRGRDVAFARDLSSLYISLLLPLTRSKSEATKMAAATLLAQCFTLKSKLTNALEEDDQAIAFEMEAIRYAQMAESLTERAIANREMASLYWRRKKYKEALPYAETAYGLAKGSSVTPIIRSFTASGLSVCQAVVGRLEEAKVSLKEAHGLFDPTRLLPTLPYGKATLSSSDACIYEHTGNWGGAIAIYEEYKAAPTTVLGNIQNNLEYARAELSRDDQPRRMDVCIALLEEAIIDARELDTKWYIQEAGELYNMLRLVWPLEKAVKQLGREHFGK